MRFAATSRFGWTSLLAAAGAFSIFTSTPARADSCQSALPRTLTYAVTRSFAGYRTPLEYDNDLQDVRDAQLNGGEACLGVASGEFLGDHKKDYVIGMTTYKNNGGMAVIAMPVKNGWRFQKLETWPEHSRTSKFVAMARPGHFARPPGTTAPLEPDERESIDCPNEAAVVGTFGAQRSLYCYLQGRWLRVQIPN